MLIHIDALDCGAATAITLLDADELPDALAILRAADSYDTGDDGAGQLTEDILDAARWRWQVENALDARAVHDETDGLDLDGLDLDELDPDEPDEPDDDAEQGPASYATMAALLRARLATMPASPKPKAPHGGHGDDLTIDFTALAQTLEQLHGAARPNRSGLSGPGRAAKLPAKRSKRDRPAPIYQVKIGIRGAKPPIWRRLQLSADTSLAALHHIIQIAFDWDDDHMHVFHTPYGEFGVADRDLGYRAEAPVTLEQVAPTVGDKIRYTYDFGDDWNLDIVVQEHLEPDTATSYPRCTGGRRAAPPEDSGGIWGYQNLIEALTHPDHPDHDHAIDWLGYTNPADFDPAHFDPNAVTKALSHRR